MAAKAPRALLVCPSAQGRADQAAPARTQCYFGSCPTRPKASLGPCLAVPTPKCQTAFGQSSCGRGNALCTRAGPNAILGPALLGPRLALVHPWQCSPQSATWRLDFGAEEAGQARRRAWVVHPKNGTQAPRWAKPKTLQNGVGSGCQPDPPILGSGCAAIPMDIIIYIINFLKLFIINIKNIIICIINIIFFIIIKSINIKIILFITQIILFLILIVLFML